MSHINRIIGVFCTVMFDGPHAGTISLQKLKLVKGGVE